MSRWMKLRRRFSPPGYDSEHERKVLMIWTILSTVFAGLWFAGAWFNLSETLDGSGPFSRKILGLFCQVVVPAVRLYAVPELCSLACIVWRFRYFFRESHSIYTIRRLGSGRELWFRTLVIPILGTILTILIQLAVYLCLRSIFMTLTGTVPENVPYDMANIIICWPR